MRGVRALILTAVDPDECEYAALRNGASGFGSRTFDGGAGRRGANRDLRRGTARSLDHPAAVLTRLGSRDRTQVVVFAHDSGLVEVGDTDIGY